jgi:uncharacterized repeat protein (TIGR01451 family)
MKHQFYAIATKKRDERLLGIFLLGLIVLFAGTSYYHTFADLSGAYDQGAHEHLSFLNQVDITVAHAAPTIIVNSTGDGADANLADDICADSLGNCTFRAALQQANKASDADVIGFDIGGGGLQTLSPATAYPTISHPLTIDGTTQPGFSGTPLIELNGSGTPGGSSGIYTIANNTIIRGLVINRFPLHGIRLDSSNNTIDTNYIGTTNTGLAMSANTGNSIFIPSPRSGNVIGSTNSAQRNVIGAHASNPGIYIPAGTSSNFVYGNYIGIKADGSGALGSNMAHGIYVSGTNNIIGGNGSQYRNVIATGSSSIPITIVSATGTIVQGNYVSITPNGNTLLDTNMSIDVSATSNSIAIGGAEEGQRNVIGLRTYLAGQNISVKGNYMGIKASGNESLNAKYHVGIFANSVTNLTIGGPNPGEGNVISGFGDQGISLNASSGRGPAIIQGNIIGLTADGTGALGNGWNAEEDDEGYPISEYQSGIEVNSQSPVTIGGSGPGEGNVISSSGFHGIHIRSTSTGPHIIQGNKIGTDAEGAIKRANTFHAINIDTVGTSNTTIGGSADGAGNIIAVNNSRVGIYNISSGVTIKGNRIGTGATSNEHFGGSSTTGIYLGTRPGNTIGGQADGEGNIIKNLATGVIVEGSGATSNRISGNSITGNSSIGIDLKGLTGVSLNDVGDGDTGPNNMQNFPVVTGASVVGESTVVDGTLNSNTSSTFTLEFFANTACHTIGYGEGETYLGSTEVSTDPIGNATFQATLPVTATTGSYISATTTSSTNDTSEFSACNETTQVVQNSTDLLISSFTVTTNAPTENDMLTYTITASNSGPITASNTQVLSLLPETLSFESATPSKGAYDDTTGIWTIGDLAPDEEVTLAIEARVNNDVGHIIINHEATISSDIEDTDETNNSATVSVTVQIADLQTSSIEISNQSPRAGEEIQLTFTVTNNGPSDSTGVQALIPLPVKAGYLSDVPTHGTFDSGTGVWTIGTLNNGASAVLVITVAVDSTIEHAVVDIIVDSLSSVTKDNNPSNDADLASFTVRVSDLSVTSITVDPSSPRVGQATTFTINATNNGPDTAVNSSLVVQMPNAVTYTSHTASKGAYEPSTGNWAIGDVLNGESVSLNISTTIDEDAGGESIEFSILTFTSDRDDPSLRNNTLLVAMAIPEPVADIQIVQKTINKTTAKENDTVSYTITAKNAGPDGASDIVIRETIPSGVHYIRSEATKGSYSPTSGLWSMNSLGVGEEATLHVLVHVDLNTSGRDIVNLAEVVSSNRPDPNAGNNSKSASFHVQELANKFRRPFIATAPGPMAERSTRSLGSLISVFSPIGTPVREFGGFHAFEEGYQGGAYVATGDIDHDGIDEIVIGEGRANPFNSGSQRIRVFEPNGEPRGIEIRPFHPNYKGGLSVAVGDVDGDGIQNEIGVCQATQGQSYCKVYRYNNAQEVLAYWNVFGDPEVGATIAFGDIDGDGKDEAIIGAGPSGGPHIRVYDIGSKPVAGANQGATLKPIQFFAFHPKSRAGVAVTAGDVDGDGKDEIGAAQLNQQEEGWVKVYRYNIERTPLAHFRAYAPNSNSGAFIRLRDINQDGKADIITGGGDNGGAHIRAFHLDGTPMFTNFFAYDQLFRGGVRFDIGVFR